MINNDLCGDATQVVSMYIDAIVYELFKWLLLEEYPRVVSLDLRSIHLQAPPQVVVRCRRGRRFPTNRVLLLRNRLKSVPTFPPHPSFAPQNPPSPQRGRLSKALNINRISL